MRLREPASRKGVGFLERRPQDRGAGAFALDRRQRHVFLAQAARAARLAAAQGASSGGGSLAGSLARQCHGPSQTARGLSGGNQQKVALARLLHQRADVLLLDEPTRGIDVGSKAEIYRVIGELAAQGKANPGRQLLSSRAVRNLRPDRRDVARRALRGPSDFGMDRARSDGSRNPRRAAGREPGRIAFAVV